MPSTEHKPRLVIGIDPGSTTGVYVAALKPVGSFSHAFQVQGTAAVWPIVQGLVNTFLHSHPGTDWIHQVRIGAEAFVESPRAGRLSGAGGARDARAVLADLKDSLAGMGVLSLNAAAVVKPWATDQRLKLTQVWDDTKGLPHARDAGRHALYTAVALGWVPDPLRGL